MNFKCGFCGKEYNVGEKTLFKSEVDDLLICSECVEACNQALEDTMKNGGSEEIPSFDDGSAMPPSEMKKHFDDYIINQESAKRKLAVAIYNHSKRVFHNENVATDKTDVKLKKSNVLMVGPSGSGKTLFVETMAKKMGVPFAIQDATSLSQAGYVGDDVEIVLKKLIENANGDIEKAQRGIIFLDEIDKIGRKGENVSITRDVSGEGVQQALLKMLEGNVVSVPINGNRKHPNQECYQIDTSNILFICGGAFEGIEKIVKKRVTKKSRVGFTTDKSDKKESKSEEYNDLIHKVTPKDLRAFGMMPEILGRLPVLCTLEELNREALVKILTEPVDSIVKQYQILFELDGIELEFTQECLEAIADKAIESGTGARALRAIMEDFMTDWMFKAPDMNLAKVTLTKECVTGEGEPIFDLQKNKE